MMRRPPRSPLFPNPTPFRSGTSALAIDTTALRARLERLPAVASATVTASVFGVVEATVDEHEARSEEHTSELQSRQYLVCRLLLEKKKKPTGRAMQKWDSVL